MSPLTTTTTTSDNSFSRYNMYRLWASTCCACAAHQHTAEEVVFERVDAEKPMVGMTNFKGNYITKEDVQIAKNYLTEQELTYLNLLVSQYLDFAEVQALQQTPMRMAEWIEKLDELMRLSGRQLLVGKTNEITIDAGGESSGEIQLSPNHLKSDNRSDQGGQEEEAPEGGGFVEDEDAQQHRADGADARPHGVGHPHGDGLRGARQQHGTQHIQQREAANPQPPLVRDA